MRSSATTVDAYLAELPEDRRQAISVLRKTIRKNLPKGYEESMQYGMIGYAVPHQLYPPGYHCDPKVPLPFVGLGSQKNHMALYMYCIYADPNEMEWFQRAWISAKGRLDMGKGCVRFRKLEDVPLDVVGQAISRVPVEQFIAIYEAGLPESVKKARAKSSESPLRATKAPAPRKKPATKKAPARKPATRKTAKTSSRPPGAKSGRPGRGAKK